MLYVGFSTRKDFNLLSWFICVYMGTPYSHVYIRFYDEQHKLWLIYEASQGEVHLEEHIQWKKKNKTIKEFQFAVNKETKFNFVVWAVKQLNKPYSIKQLFGILFYDLFKWDFLRSNGFTCSELVANALALDIKLNKPYDYITPKDLYGLITGLKNSGK